MSLPLTWEGGFPNAPVVVQVSDCIAATQGQSHRLTVLHNC